MGILSRLRRYNWDRIGKMRLQRKVKRRNVKAMDTAGDEFESRWLKRLDLRRLGENPPESISNNFAFPFRRTLGL